MSLPRFLVPLLPRAGRVALDAQESRHASQVLRLSTGDQVELFDGRGGSATATVIEAGKRATVIEVLAWGDVDRELPWGLELFIALPKGDRQKQLVDALVQFGVYKLTPLATERSVAQPTDGALERLERSVIEASKQCGRNWLMEIGRPLKLAELVGEELGPGERWFAHPYGRSIPLDSVALHAREDLPPPVATLARAEQSGSIRARCVIGPEGGLTAAEAEALAAAGWQQVSLGGRILRVEMAATAVAVWWSLRHGVRDGLEMH